MNHPRVLYQMVRADFLERVRRYSFLLSLGFSVYLGYTVYSGLVSLRLENYRGVNNAAWLGSVIALTTSVWLSLIGFYIVKNSIQRDRETRVGQILATTPISKGFYTLSKALSNFAVLAAMVLVMAAAALVIQLFSIHEGRPNLVALLAPVLVFGLCSVAVTASLAVLFETLPVLRGGVGNIVYFFLWTSLLVFGTGALDKGVPLGVRQYISDYSGIATIMGQMQAEVRQLDPLYHGGASFNISNTTGASARTFLWAGIKWNGAILLGRAVWLAIAAALASVAAIFFDRFDPSREGLMPGRRSPAKAATGADEPLVAPDLGIGAGVGAFVLTPLSRTKLRGRFVALVLAELRLLLTGHSWWWYAVAAGLFIGCLTSPLDAARSGVITVAWLWPALIWSQLGTQEARFATGPLIFSAQRAFPRQLLAAWTAGVLVAALTGGGLALRLILAGDFSGLAAWAAGACFIPSLALALGVCTEGRKSFEAIYTIWWYAGPLHHVPRIDFMGTTPMSSTPAIYFTASVILLTVACCWRRTRLAYA
jgi:hypothetical protein